MTGRIDIEFRMESKGPGVGDSDEEAVEDSSAAGSAKTDAAERRKTALQRDGIVEDGLKLVVLYRYAGRERNGSGTV